MSDWLTQYTAGLRERDVREQAHKRYIDAFTRLADRTSSLETSRDDPSPRPSSANTEQSTRRRNAASKDPEPVPSEFLDRLRADLSTTQKARTALQTQVTSLTTSVQALELQQKTSTTQIAHLARQKADIERRLRDRDEELRGKTKLAEDAQDEMVALGLQLNVAEQKAANLNRENRELVDRWMKRMGEEADRVNRDSKWE